MPRRVIDRIVQDIQVEAWRLLHRATAPVMSAETREIARESIARSHPSYTRDEVEQALQRLLHGPRAPGGPDPAF